MPTYQSLEKVLSATLSRKNLTQLKEDLAEMKKKYPNGHAHIEMIEKEISKK